MSWFRAGRALSCAATLLPAACSASGVSGSAVQAMPASSRPTVVTAPERRTIDADDMLFVGDGEANIVRILDFSRRNKPVSQISIGATGVCSDAAGDVWVAGYISGAVGLYEYRHDGSGPISQLPLVGRPTGCAIDATSGDLAVANEGTNGVSTVDVFKNAQGTPIVYSQSNVAGFYYCAYDDQGNLFVQGLKFQEQPQAVASELQHGGKSLAPIYLGPFHTVPGGLAWDGKHLAVAFSDSEVLYRFKTGTFGATLVDSHVFAMNDNGFFGIAVNKHRLATIDGPRVDDDRDYSSYDLAKFQYPIGAKELDQRDAGIPAGIAISLGATSQRHGK